MKRNEEMVTAGWLWCSCWRTAFGGVSVHQMPCGAGAATGGSPRGAGHCKRLVSDAHLWWISRIHRSNLWDPPGSGFPLPIVQGEHFPHLLSQWCQAAGRWWGVVTKEGKGTLTGGKKCFGLVRMGSTVRRDREWGVWSVCGGKGSLVRAQSTEHCLAVLVLE